MSMTKLTRVQRKRTKGYRLPPRTVCCTRPGPLGNPWHVSDDFPTHMFTPEFIPHVFVREFRRWVQQGGLDVQQGQFPIYAKLAEQHKKFEAAFAKLKAMVEAGEVGYLACYCGEGPCHVDVLIEMLGRK